MAIYRVQGPDGAIHKFEGPDNATPDQVTAAAQAQFGSPAPAAPKAPVVAAPEQQGPGNWQVTNNAINKGLAGAADAVVNAPVNALNLVKAGVGTRILQAKNPENKYNPIDYLIRASGIEPPELTQTPDIIRHAMEKPGFINQASEPRTGLQRILDTGGQFVGGSVVNPASGVRQAASNAVKSGLTGLLSGGVKEATGSDAAAMATGLLAPVGMNAAGNAGRRSVANVPKPNSVMNDTLEAARKEGLVVPPTSVNPSNVNRVLESIGGKAATKQAASIKNQPVIDSIARREAGLMPDEPITPQTLKAARDKHNKVYEEIRAIPSLKIDAEYGNSPLAPKPFVGSMMDKNINTDEAISAISKLRADARGLFKLNNGNPHPDDLAKAHASQSAANDLESLIERNLQRQTSSGEVDKLNGIKNQLYLAARNMQSLGKSPILDKLGEINAGIDSALKTAKASGNSELLTKFREARKALAKNHQVEDALREGSGSIDARKLAQATQKQAPLSGGLKTIGDFANNFENATQPLRQIGSPGVSKLEVGQAGAGGVLGTMLGGPVGGAVGVVGTMVVPPAIRKMMLSPKYQAYMAKTGASPSMVAKALSKLPPGTDADTALQAITSGRILAQQPNRLTELLGEQ